MKVDVATLPCKVNGAEEVTGLIAEIVSEEAGNYLDYAPQVILDSSKGEVTLETLLRNIGRVSLLMQEITEMASVLDLTKDDKDHLVSLVKREVHNYIQDLKVQRNLAIN